jgi:hypothetical protein
MPGRTGVEAVGNALDDGAFAANISNDFLKGGNRFLPIASTLLSIPLAAVGLKKYFCGTAPVSMTPDNVDSFA